MRQGYSDQSRLDSPGVANVRLNLNCRDEIIPILAGLQPGCHALACVGMPSFHITQSALNRYRHREQIKRERIFGRSK